MEIKITQEKRDEVERIQKEFRSKLSPNEILRGTAQGVNSALTRSIPRINKRIKERYNISQKYLSRQAVVSPKANSGSLYGGIKINENRLPVIAFKPKQSGSSISVAIHKGKTTMIRHAFVATMSSGHKGVFSRGRYQKRIGFVPGREKTASGKIRIAVHNGHFAGRADGRCGVYGQRGNSPRPRNTNQLREQNRGKKRMT